MKKALSIAKKKGAAVPGIPVTDTVKEVKENKNISGTLDRRRLYLIQTPQVFKFDILLKAYRHAYSKKFFGTDDASLVEKIGGKIEVVPGSCLNIKITTREDLSLAEAILKVLNTKSRHHET